MTDQTFDTEGVVAQGDSVVMFGRERGRWKSTGEPYGLQHRYRFTFRDGLVHKVSQISAPTAGSWTRCRSAYPGDLHGATRR